MSPTPQTLREKWAACWPDALRVWSPFVVLREPIWCTTASEEQKEGLTGSFAMIRLVDHRVVISLRQVEEKHLEKFAMEILAHEIGHHVYCPADLTDNARTLARIRHGLPAKENYAPMISNLYTDLLINDRLQRSAGLSMAAVYQQLNITGGDKLWLLYMRTYELLWRLEPGTLAQGDISSRMNSDAQLATRLIRNYAKDWVDGAGRFAALCWPYLAGDGGQGTKHYHPWNDTRDAGQGGLPAGLTEVDEEEETGAIHPALDPVLTGEAQEPRTADSGRKSLKELRGPVEYREVLKAAGAHLPDEVMNARYYKELALPHLIKFPTRESPLAADPTPEGLETWDVGGELENIDWMGTLTASPLVIPGVTTRERVYGSAPGFDRERAPLDLYLGVDCSGSMGNPANNLSYPIMAAAVVALSALRAGANVMVALSGEPGKTVTTDGFIRDEAAVLTTLTMYLGTGMTFGIHRLREMPAQRRPVHILIITDNDIFTLLGKEVDARLGWDVAREAAAAAGGGATYVLQLPAYFMAHTRVGSAIQAGEARMMEDGWRVSHVDTMAELLEFARAFSEEKYAR